MLKMRCYVGGPEEREVIFRGRHRQPLLILPLGISEWGYNHSVRVIVLVSIKKTELLQESVLLKLRENSLCFRILIFIFFDWVNFEIQ